MQTVVPPTQAPRPRRHLAVRSKIRAGAGVQNNPLYVGSDAGGENPLYS
jgi:hypothetical protein